MGFWLNRKGHTVALNTCFTKEPVRFAFDPNQSRNQEFLEVWADTEARIIWLLLRGGNAVGGSFFGLCLSWAQAIRERQPGSAEDLFAIVHDIRAGFFVDLEASRPLLDRILLALDGSRPVEWSLIEKEET